MSDARAHSSASQMLHRMRREAAEARYAAAVGAMSGGAEYGFVDPVPVSAPATFGLAGSPPYAVPQQVPDYESELVQEPEPREGPVWLSWGDEEAGAGVAREEEVEVPTTPEIAALAAAAGATAALAAEARVELYRLVLTGRGGQMPALLLAKGDTDAAYAVVGAGAAAAALAAAAEAAPRTLLPLLSASLTAADSRDVVVAVTVAAAAAQGARAWEKGCADPLYGGSVSPIVYCGTDAGCAAARRVLRPRWHDVTPPRLIAARPGREVLGGQDDSPQLLIVEYDVLRSAIGSERLWEAVREGSQTGPVCCTTRGGRDAAAAASAAALRRGSRFAFDLVVTQQLAYDVRCDVAAARVRLRHGDSALGISLRNLVTGGGLAARRRPSVDEDPLGAALRDALAAYRQTLPDEYSRRFGAAAAGGAYIFLQDAVAAGTVSWLVRESPDVRVLYLADYDAASPAAAAVVVAAAAAVPTGEVRFLSRRAAAAAVPVAAAVVSVLQATHIAATAAAAAAAIAITAPVAAETAQQWAAAAAAVAASVVCGCEATVSAGALTPKLCTAPLQGKWFGLKPAPKPLQPSSRAPDRFEAVRNSVPLIRRPSRRTSAPPLPRSSPGPPPTLDAQDMIPISRPGAWLLCGDCVGGCRLGGAAVRTAAASLCRDRPSFALSVVVAGLLGCAAAAAAGFALELDWNSQRSEWGFLLAAPVVLACFPLLAGLTWSLWLWEVLLTAQIGVLLRGGGWSSADAAYVVAGPALGITGLQLAKARWTRSATVFAVLAAGVYDLRTLGYIAGGACVFSLAVACTVYHHVRPAKTGALSVEGVQRDSEGLCFLAGASVVHGVAFDAASRWGGGSAQPIRGVQPSAFALLSAALGVMAAVRLQASQRPAPPVTAGTRQQAAGVAAALVGATSWALAAAAHDHWADVRSSYGMLLLAAETCVLLVCVVDPIRRTAGYWLMRWMRLRVPESPADAVGDRFVKAVAAVAGAAF
eukprot:TRINITY_DN3836_c1_g1_i1.p1 TRINITY_DN3836_c1_g1~~TRINITY_DN3836_c1_g1_i1.p1  ORF type:complete len:1032 (+),score=272.03 TRINITY_DN3836_c1_g1_i1:136-3096(+)